MKYRESEHGRLKVKTTAEQEEAKRKEREKKLKLYTAGTNKALEKRRNEEYDEEALEITGQLLAANPDVYSLWNFRKEIYTHMKQHKSVVELTTLFDAELGFVEQALRANPKSYGAWEQRCWVMLARDDPDWKHELKLCNKYLEYDERNFHCWDYRRFVVKHAQVSPEEELEFTTAKISTNFSNYSSWHYRSKLLPVIHPDPSSAVGVKEDVLLQEFELAQNAFFTDPNDQSAWFYHRWLLGRAEKPLSIDCLHLSRDRVTVLLTKTAKLGQDFSMSLTVDGEAVTTDWSSATRQEYCSVWYCTVTPSLSTDKDHSIELSLSLLPAGDSPVVKQDLTLLQLEDDAWWMPTYKKGKRFTSELSAAKSDILQQELESCLQLDDLEPNNKWIQLTIVWLMRAIDPIIYQIDCLRFLKKLISVDPLRCNYYHDMRSKYSIENTIETNATPESRLFSLSEQNLTAWYHSNCLATKETVNLSHNALQSFPLGCQLLCLKVLNLDHNSLKSCDGLEGMLCLEMLCIQHNKLEQTTSLAALTSCPRLTLVHLNGNPVCEHADRMNKIKQMAKSCGFSVIF